MKPLKIGLIGLGQVAEAHLEAYNTSEQVRVVAGADPDETRRALLSKQWGFQEFADYRQMVGKTELDVVCVLTPVSTHAQVVEDCAEAGLNILCEKPIAIDLKSAQHMMEVCAERNVNLFYGASYRFLPPLAKAKALIVDGAIGDILLMSELLIGGSGAESYSPLSVIHYPEGGPGGSGLGLVDHGVHLIDAFSWLSGANVETVFGRGNLSGATPAIEHLQMTFANNALGQLLYCDRTFSTNLPTEGAFVSGGGWDFSGYAKKGGWQPHPGCIHIHGSKGALRIFHYANTLYMFDANGARQISLPNLPPPAHFKIQIETFAQNIRDDATPAVSATDGIAALRVLLAAYESYKQQTVIDMRLP